MMMVIIHATYTWRLSVGVSYKMVGETPTIRVEGFLSVGVSPTEISCKDGWWRHQPLASLREGTTKQSHSANRMSNMVGGDTDH
ncbi:hypothetical protein EV200_10996 [Pedobacter psychrotolerans]|uniref:Uncharacterized protein n=1 Tax=Pedobacter psychrotolerans TaxID=1843235 RepID=A0A4R2H453_9SPHI|nr:hypothetical protein EV200_10996 [Pedobacter psychrotolerans]